MSSIFNRIYSRDFAASMLLISLVTLLGAGLHNVADGFADVKLSGSPIIHWGAAAAIELGVVAIGLTIAVRARSGNRNLRLYLGILVFVAASVFANYDASLESLTGGRITWQALKALDRWTLTKAALLGGAIPVMVLLVIESLRELASEPDGVAYVGASSLPHQDNVDIRETRGRSETPVPARSNGHSRGPRADRETMRRLIQDEPTISATELARRLQVGRATVYRWRDDLGASRTDGIWVVQ